MPQKVKKIYMCSVCKKQHDVYLDPDIIKNQVKFPMEYFYVHRFETANLEEAGANILSTLFIDATLNIRGAESYKLIKSDIVSTSDTKDIVNSLMSEIQNLNEETNKLREENQELRTKLKKYEP